MKRQINFTQESPSLSFNVWKEAELRLGQVQVGRKQGLSWVRWKCAGQRKALTFKLKLISILAWTVSSHKEEHPLTVPWVSLVGPVWIGLGEYLYAKHHGTFFF